VTTVPPRSADTPDISIDELERAVFTRDYDRAGLLLLQLLQAIKLQQGGFTREGGGVVMSAAEEQRILTRIAGAMLALMADPGMRISGPGFERLALLNSAVGSVFELSGFGSSEHIWRLVGQRGPNGQVQFTEDALRKAYGLSTLSGLPEPLVEQLPLLPKAISVPALLGLMSHDLVLTEQANRNRNRLLGMGHLLDDFMLSDHLAGRISSPYMLCSYADLPSKHAIKRHLNKAVRLWLELKGVKPRALSPRANAKPKMIVAMEFARINHAMLRCYRGVIDALRERYHLVAITDPTATDDATRALFDEVIPAPLMVEEVKDFFERLHAVEADVVYFPSVGMASWCIWLSNVRVAPLQVMTLGHPATSHSEEIDFALASTGIDFDPACFSEKLVLVEGAGASFELHSEALDTPPKIRENPEVLRIAVPAKLFKLSAGFLAACAEIARRSTRPIEFHFFPNEIGALYQTARQRVESALPEVRTYTWPRTGYGRYLANLDECDIAISGFTFGNTNGAVDALLRGLPIVALDGPELHQGPEQILMRPLGLPKWMVASSVEDYIDAVIKLIEDDELRVRISQPLPEATREFIKSEKGMSAEFADAIHWMQTHRDELLARPEKVLNPPKTP